MSTIAVGTDTLFIRDSGGIQYSTDNLIWTPITAWPVTILNMNFGTTLMVSFVTDITLTTVTRYFICGTNNIQFGDRDLRPDGTVPTINITVPNYPGLVQNGSAGNSGKNNITICNLFVSALSGLSCSDSGGWIAQQWFGRGATNNLILNCKSNGNIGNNGGGGIAGNFTAFNGGNVVIRGCMTAGNTGTNGGGIVGQSSGYGAGSILTVEECSSSGTIRVNAGGIFGPNCGGDNGVATAIRCYSTGLVSEGNSGGIFGAGCAQSGSAVAVNCYSLGNIVGGEGGGKGGGIFGRGSGTPSVSVIATNCFSTGSINSGSGGIFGTEYEIGTATANNCYTTGAVSGVGSGGIWAESDQDNLQGSNNYAESNHSSSGWNDIRALTTLTGAPGVSPAGTSWISLGPNQPYRLRTIGFSPYLFTNITNTYTFTTTFSESVAAGSSGSAAILPAGYAYTIVAINDADPSTVPEISMNAATGQIETTPTLALGTYTIVLQAEINPYSVTTVEMTVTEYVPPPSPVPNPLVVPACCDTLPLIRPSPATNHSSEVITVDRGGKVIVRNVNTYYDAIAKRSVTYLAKPVFGSYREYMEYLQGQ
jgi:hypothetical protein